MVTKGERGPNYGLNLTFLLVLVGSIEWGNHFANEKVEVEVLRTLVGLFVLWLSYIVFSNA